MDLDARATLDADPDAVLSALADLSTYPHWLTIVASAIVEPDVDDAWSVELAGRIGPFTRRKRVRMVRTELDPAARAVRFERREQDGRTHNEWVLAGTTTPAADLHIHLHYGGGRQLPGADFLLRQEVRSAGTKLQAFLDAAKR
ncbi:MAG TPA: SRPBCC family protein [Acidimicrobiales bacterium]|nr:SRPBCC family protein [Acidimicrobiales bacterium]